VDCFPLAKFENIVYILNCERTINLKIIITTQFNSDYKIAVIVLFKFKL